MSLSTLPLTEKTPDGAVTHPNPVVYRFDGEHRFFSNFWPCHVTLPAADGLPEQAFASVENAYVAWKTLDPMVRAHIADMTPGDAKKLSRDEGFLLRPDITDESRQAIMADLVGQKFDLTRNPELCTQLQATAPAVLMEGNMWNDTFFGVNLQTMAGHNHLGRILMNVRDQPKPV